MTFRPVFYPIATTTPSIHSRGVQQDGVRRPSCWEKRANALRGGNYACYRLPQGQEEFERQLFHLDAEATSAR